MSDSNGDAMSLMVRNAHASATERQAYLLQQRRRQAPDDDIPF